jgi:hypothetical protein
VVHGHMPVDPRPSRQDKQEQQRYHIHTLLSSVVGIMQNNGTEVKWA